MATVIIAVIVFGIVGVDVAYLIYNLVHHTGKFGCSECSGCGGCGGCSGCASECGGNCPECSSGCGKAGHE